jgi:glycosyltransferase involved in cell wall biosynthesis
VSDEKLLSLYHEAKVFALPSINEGVGLVAVEAAACGCNIVVTNVGGPKEYYNGMAYEVDPLNSDEIGRAIVEALKDTRSQPDLQKYILSNYSLESCVSLLAESYRELVQQ